METFDETYLYLFFLKLDLDVLVVDVAVLFDVSTELLEHALHVI